MFSIARNLGSFRVNSFVRVARRREDKVTKERAEGRVKERDENIRTFAGRNERRSNIEGNSAFMNNRRSGFERIPVMNVSRRLRDFVGDKVSNVVSRKITNNAMKRTIKAITESIM